MRGFRHAFGPSTDALFVSAAALEGLGEGDPARIVREVLFTLLDQNSCRISVACIQRDLKQLRINDKLSSIDS